MQRQDGGPTQWDNLACLCVKHHHLKDETAWQVVQLPGAVLEWTSPAGHVYTTYPELELPVADLPVLDQPGVDLGAGGTLDHESAQNDDTSNAPF